MRKEISEDITCAVCGVSNPADRERCVACGARLFVAQEDNRSSRSRHKPAETIAWRWVLGAFVVLAVVTGLVFLVFPKVLQTFDPQGLPGMGIVFALWFLVGLFVGRRGPGKCFFEASIATVFAAVPTSFLLIHISDIYSFPVVIYVVGCALGTMMAMLGSVLGYRLKHPSRVP